MAWTTPRTWEDGEIVTADQLNTHIRDNMDYLKERMDGTAKQYIRTSSNYTTTSTSLVDVDGSNMSLTLTTDGSDVLVTFCALASLASGAKRISMGVKIDTTDYLLVSNTSVTTTYFETNVNFCYVFTGLSAGSHDFILRWKSNEGVTATLTAGTVLFDVREMIGLVA